MAAVELQPANLGTVAQAFLDQLVADLTSLSPAGAPGTSYLSPGPPPYDVDVVCGGLAWVCYLGLFPSTHFPAQDNQLERCRRVAGRLQVGVVRCIDVPDPSQLSTVIEDLQNGAAATMYAEAVILTQSILEVIASPLLDEVAMFEGVTPVDPQGGVLGSFGTVVFDLTSVATS